MVRLAAFVLLLAGAAGKVHAASDWQETSYSKVRLLWADAIPYQGRTVSFAGIEIVLDPGWKTYWRMPGDGLAATFDWSGSDNLKSAKVLWPAPARFDGGSGIAAVGYREQVVLPVLVDPGDEARPMTLSLRFGYGVCKDICIPVEVALTATVAPGAAEDREPIQAALARVPRPQNQGIYCPHSLITVKRRLVDGRPALVIKTAFDESATGLDLFAEPPEGMLMGQPARQPYSTRGRAYFVVAFDTQEESEALRGKLLGLTMVSDQGSCETSWRVE
ncbi:MAG: hypothetical protein HC850_00985 [Rhodomicrobium sp.]|nr:hypothetical protein [Rhodomicrobium sp.]